MKGLLLTAALLLGGASRPWAQTPQAGKLPIFAAQVDSVLIDAFVTSGGVNVAGLSARDFVLKEDGVVRPFDLLPADSLPIRAILAFDTSSSMRGPKLDRLRLAAEAFLDRLRPQDEAGLLSFSDEIAWRSPLTTNRAPVRYGILSLQANGATSAYDALFCALAVPRPGSRTLVILFSDGEDNRSWLSEKQIKGAIERSNALIHVVAARSEDFRSGPASAFREETSYVKALRSFAAITGGSLIEVASPDRIEAAFNQIVEQMKSRYVLRYTPEGEPTPGWHSLDLQLVRGKAKVRSRTGYWVGKS